jgi:hypothetical protein
MKTNMVVRCERKKVSKRASSIQAPVAGAQQINRRFGAVMMGFFNILVVKPIRRTLLAP